MIPEYQAEATDGERADGFILTTHQLSLGVKLGALGLSLPLIGGRWGSYIGIAPIYLADFLLFLGALLTFALPNDHPKARFSKFYWFCWTSTVAFLIVSLLHGNGEFVTRIRDLIPWFYLLLLPTVVQWAVAAGRRRILNYLTVTLLAHAAWAVPALASVLPPVDLGLRVLGQPMFTERADIDVPLLACAIVLVLYRWGWRFTTGIFTILAAGAAAAQTSRAALVGGVVAIGFFARFRGKLTGAQGAIRLLGVGVTAAFVVLVLLPTLSARQADRFDMGALARAGLYGSASAAASGQRTATDRFQAWGILLRHYANEGYPPLGAGPGTEIIRNTGTVRYFGGDVETRQPHNWWVHMLVRTGYVGTLLWVALLVSGARVAMRARRGEHDFLTALGGLMIVSILLTSTFGVVIEAPFGSQILLLGMALFGLRAQTAGHP